MLVTFYLSGPYSSTTVSSKFTIVGNPGAETFTGVTKAQLLTGHSLTFSESVTGGTVTTTEPETCVGTVVNWFVELQPTPTPTVTPTPLNRFYVASPVLDIDTTYCVTPGYVLTGALWSYATTISGLMNQQVYLDQYGDDVFIGVEGYKYGISLTAGINTYNDGTSNYYLIQIDQYGYVYNVLSPNCGTSGGGGDVPL